MPAHRLHSIFGVAVAAALGMVPAGAAKAQPGDRHGQVITPDSSIEAPDDIGLRAHTNIKMLVPTLGVGTLTPPSLHNKGLPSAQSPPAPGYNNYETPASLACVYGLASGGSPTCNPYDPNIRYPTTSAVGSKAIAIVDAYHYPTAMSDLAVFSQQFGLPAPTAANFQVVYASGSKPRINSGWNVEEALDIQWAHAMAPNAKIYLIEASSSSYSALLQAISVANSLVSKAGGGEVSMSWGGSEFYFESLYDNYFRQSGIVYFAAAGDSPGVMWPSVSTNVVAVGGTSLSRNPTTGDFQGELAWQSTGGGSSAYYARPSYQNAVSGIVGGARGVPDVAADADPATGVWVYLSPYWYIVGGTSVATPVWAGIVNSAGKFSANTATELTKIYLGLSSDSADFNDIVNGSCGPNEGYWAAQGWDFCTGVGSPQGAAGK